MKVRRYYYQPLLYISLRSDQRASVCSVPDSLHSVPVAQMGNYQEYLKMMPSPLRELDPDQPKRLHTFGNPFKQDKKVEDLLARADLQAFVFCSALRFYVLTQGMMIDEADEFVTGPQSKKRGSGGDLSSGVTVKRRRSMSPLLRRSQTPPGSHNHGGAGNSPAGVQGQQNALKDIPQHRGQIRCNGWS